MLIHDSMPSSPISLQCYLHRCRRLIDLYTVLVVMPPAVVEFSPVTQPWQSCCYRDFTGNRNWTLINTTCLWAPWWWNDGVCAHGLWLELSEKLLTVVQRTSKVGWPFHFQNWNGCLSWQSWVTHSLFVFHQTTLLRPNINRLFYSWFERDRIEIEYWYRTPLVYSTLVKHKDRHYLVLWIALSISNQLCSIQHPEVHGHHFPQGPFVHYCLL